MRHRLSWTINETSLYLVFLLKKISVLPHRIWRDLSQNVYKVWFPSKSCEHGRRKAFFQGPLVDLYKNFSRGEVVKFVFFYSKLRKQPFLLKFSKHKGI